MWPVPCPGLPIITNGEGLSCTYLHHRSAVGSSPHSWTLWHSEHGCQRWISLGGHSPQLHWGIPNAWNSQICSRHCPFDQRWSLAWLCTQQQWCDLCCPRRHHVDAAKWRHQICAQIGHTGCRSGLDEWVNAQSQWCHHSAEQQQHGSDKAIGHHVYRILQIGTWTALPCQRSVIKWE